MQKIMSALSRLINPKDRERDVKLLAFAAVVIAAICWLSYEIKVRGISPNWVETFAWLCALVGIGGAGWSAVEKWKGGKSDQSTTPQQTVEQAKGPKEGENS
jgi:hypothetical protein